VNGVPLSLSESIPELGDKPAVAWLRYDVLDEELFVQGKNLVTATVEKEMGESVKIDEARLDVRYAQ